MVISHLSAFFHCHQSTYNMSEALHALPPVPPVKREAVSPRMDGLLNLGSVTGFFDEGSNSIDKLLK